MVSHSKVAMRRLSTARLWPRAEYSWGIGLRGERTKQNGGQENNRTKDRAKDRMEDRARDRAKDMAKDRAEDRTRDRTENRTGRNRRHGTGHDRSRTYLASHSAARQWSRAEYT